jgi:hypothetical protein
MPVRKTSIVLLALGAAAGAAFLRLQMLRSRNRVRVDVYFEDGSVESLLEGTPEAARLLSLARDVRSAAG